MRRISLLVGVVGFFCVGAMGAIVACGDDDSNAVITDPDAAVAAEASSGATSSSSGAATSSSSGSPSDAGTDSPSSSSGDLPSNPGQLTCGTVVCDAGGGGFGPGNGQNLCCQSVTEANTKCSKSQQCNNEGNNGNLRLGCDETKDCDNNDICCYVKDGNQNPSFTATCRSRQFCRTGFNPQSKPRPQLCKTSEECGDAGVCNLKACDGFKLHVCGSPEGCQ